MFTAITLGVLNLTYKGAVENTGMWIWWTMCLILSFALDIGVIRMVWG